MWVFGEADGLVCLLVTIVAFVWQAFAEAVQHNHSLTALNLQSSGIGAEDLEARFGSFPAICLHPSHAGVLGRGKNYQTALYARRGLLELGLWRTVDWLRA